MSPSKPRGQKARPALVTNLLLLAASLLLCVVAMETVFRVTRPQRAFHAANELENFRLNREDLTQHFEIDPDFGFRPILGNELYNEHGTRTNGYVLEKPAGKARILFLGDSVTARGHIVEAVRDLLGDEHYEYWNAGVESFNTVQEVNYFRRYNVSTMPDHVILTFNLNDFGTTPIALMNDERTIVVYAPNRPLQEINPWLFRHSYTYRFVLGLMSKTKTDRHGVIEEVRASLGTLGGALDQEGVKLTVLILPTLLPLDEWSEDDRQRREIIRGLLDELGISYVDLLDPLRKALADGVAVMETPGDAWHPSRAVAAYFARHAQEIGVLERRESNSAGRILLTH